MTQKEESIDHTVHLVDSDSKVIEVFEQNLPESQVLEEVDSIIEEHNLDEHRYLLVRGALLANDSDTLSRDTYSHDEKRIVQTATSHPTKSLSSLMLAAALATSFAAVDFGMDESAVGGAQLQYSKQFGITDPNMRGFVIASPYLAAAVIGSPLTVFLNEHVGRKILILIACFIGVSGSLWQSFANGTAALLVGRLYLDVNMGMNFAVVPVFIAGCSPAITRGMLLILWQTFVALGVCLRAVFNRAFVEIEVPLSWWLMIRSSSVLPLLCAIAVLFPPTSPRCLILKGSLELLIKLRPSPLSGAGDFYILENELNQKVSPSQQFISLFTVKRNRFAVWVSFLGVFGQQYAWCEQFCLIHHYDLDERQY